MKRKYAAIMLGLTLALSSAAVYAAEDATEVSDTEMAGDTAEASEDESLIFGQVTEITDDSITVELGERIEEPDGQEDTGSGELNAGEEDASEEASEDEDTSEVGDASEGQEPDGSHPLSIELTGEEQTISLTDSTIALWSVQTDMTLTTQTEAADEEAATEAEDDELPAVESVAEEIDIKDLIVGDVVSISLDEDGNAAEITVIEAAPSDLTEEEAGEEASDENGNTDASDEEETAAE